MSGKGRDVFNATDQIRLGADYIIRLCRGRYASDPALCELLKWHHGFVIPRRLSWGDAERESHAAQAVMWNVWQGSASTEEVADFKKKIGAFRERCKKEGRIDICDTVYSRIIIAAFEEALYATENGMKWGVYIKGPPGCGKSIVTEALCRDNNHGRCTFYEPTGDGGMRQMKEDIGGLKGIDVNSNSIKLTNRILNCFIPGMLLAVDEIHLLAYDKTVKQPRIDFLRRIMDRCHIALFTLATGRTFETNVISGKWDDKQWWRRMEIIDLPPEAPDVDIDSLFAFKFPDMELPRETREYLLNINHHPKGGFGQVAFMFDKVILRAKKAAQPITITSIEREADAKWTALDRRR